jgi:hypothetical protein
MSFFQTARRAGAEEYGRRRAESYGKQARASAVLGVLLAVVLVLGIVAAAQGALGG